MEKKKTPVSTVIFYIIGIILLIVAAFMLWTAVNYTKTYLTSYEATFKDMWTNSVQYIITQFVPYLGMGVICIGIGRAIYGSANAKVAQTADAAETPEGAKAETAEAADAPADGAAEAAEAAEAAADNAETEAPVKAEAGVAAAGAAVGAAAGAGAVSASQLEELIRRIDTNREVLSIKIEEKEKRDSFRIKELEKKVDGFLSDVKYINEPLEELVYKQAAGIDETPEETADIAEAAAVAAPAVAAAAAAEAIDTTEETEAESVEVATAAEAEEAEATEPAPAAAVPQIFTVSRRMTAPACPAAKPAAEEPAAVTEAGVVPQIFTVSRRMTAPACPAVQG